MKMADILRDIADLLDQQEEVEVDGSELDTNPVMVSPLQQELELAKSEQGKSSPVIDKMLQGDDIGKEINSDETDDQLLDRIKQLITTQ